MRAVAIAIIASLWCAPVFSQELAPEVLLLSRVRRHVTEQLQKLPDVSCLETVFREHQPRGGKMRPLDTVRLEVRTDGPTELYASPGDRRFSPEPPISWVGSGTLGDGFFSLYLRSVFLNGNVAIFWKGDEIVNGRNLPRWDYRVPLSASGQTFHLQSGSGKVSLHGSFWADPETLDVVRLAVSAGDIPPTLPISGADWTMDYAPVVAGSGEPVLLPQSADFAMQWLSGEATRARFAFTQCRSYSAESTIRFDVHENDSQPEQFGVTALDDTLRSLPAAASVAVKLMTRLSKSTPVGALVEGSVSSDVRFKGMVVLEKGAIVKGRLRRLEHYTEPTEYFVVGIEYTEVASQGIRYRFDASLQSIEPRIAIERSLSLSPSLEREAGPNTTVVRRETVSLTELPGVATFFVRGNSLTSVEDLVTTWISRTPRSH